jgi:large repetitive protein
MSRWMLAACGLALVVSSSAAAQDTNAWLVADAGPNWPGARNTVLQLDGTLSRHSDPNTPLTYSWVQLVGPPVVLTGADTPQPSFTVPDVPVGTELQFQLVVSDGVLSDSAIMRSQVIATNHPPTANAGPNQSVTRGQLVQVDGTDSWDPDSTIILSYRWVQLSGPPVTLSSYHDRMPYFYEPDSPEGTVYTFQLTVSDGYVQRYDTANVVVNSLLPPPVVNAGPDRLVEELSEVTLDGTGSYDEDDEPLTYEWRQIAGPAVALAGFRTAQPTFTAPAVESDTVLTFMLWLSDGHYVRTDTVDITVRKRLPPQAKAGPDLTVDEGTQVELNGSGSWDPNLGTLLSYEWEQVAGPAVTLSDVTSAQPTFTAPEVIAPRVLTFRLRASDGVLSSTDTVDVTVRNVWR